MLYVDDDPDNLLVFRSNLADDFFVMTCGSGDEALRLLEDEVVSVVLTDQRMPGMTGVDLCEQVRARHPEVRRLLMTAYSDQQTAVEAINRGGVHGFLVKPWDEEHLRRVLTGELERLHLSHELVRLRALIVEHEQQLHVANVRARLMHDVANVTQRLNLSFTQLSRMLVSVESDGLRGESLERARLSSEKMKSALEHLMALHTEQRRTHDKQLPQTVTVAQAAESAQSLAGLEPAGGVRVHTTVSAGLTAFVDPVSLTRILVNLLRNASQALLPAQPRGRIHLDATAEDGWAVIDVADTGPGVAPELREKIFEERFSTRRGAGGTGLGLCSARALAEANGGSLELVDDGHPGARFRLRLPRRPPTTDELHLPC